MGSAARLPTLVLNNLMRAETRGIMTEEWKQIDGFGGRYWVSNYGRVYTTYNKKLLNPRFRGDKKYGFVGLRYNGICKYMTVHKLVAIYFVPNPNLKECTVVNHIDANRLNNRADNLEWVTPAQNIRHAIYTSGNFKQMLNPIMPIKCVETGDIYPSASEAARQIGMGKTHLLRAVRDPWRTAKGCHWTKI